MTQSRQRLRAVREAKGFSLDRVSGDTEIDKAQLSKIERGIQRPTLPVLVRICRAIGLTEEAKTIERLWP